MTIVEKSAYLKGLTEGLGVDPETKEGKLWSVLCDLVSDMAHEIEDLQSSNLDFADALDEIADELTYLEEITCDLDVPEDMMDDEDESPYLPNLEILDEDSQNEEEDGDEEISYDGVIYDVTCPKCGEEISFDEATLELGSLECPECGELLEFDLDELD